ncbi:ParA family protein [Clostridium sp. K25]|uniref:ParA family protein n=1 Tax=Clostridium sp. K25 TaxID=1443109 RepID=UPI0004DADE26|nr:ParA family protein [Clostridium sp. K25]KEI06337.1 SpoOJ regulator, soj/para family [Clostridium sp. K25]
MTTVISMINVKGGVGKTTSCINVAGEISSQGHKVLLIDNDSQGNLTQILNTKSKYNIYDLYSNDNIQYEDCISKYNNNIDIINNTIESCILEKELHRQKYPEGILNTKWEKFKDSTKYDFVLIDNSPFLGVMVQNSLVMSDYYIEVIDSSTSALQGLNMVQKVIDELDEYALVCNLKLLGILRNNFQKRTIFSKQFKEVTEETLQDKLFNTIVYNRIKYKEAVAMHKTIQEYSKKHANVYKDLYYELVKRINS